MAVSNLALIQDYILQSAKVIQGLESKASEIGALCEMLIKTIRGGGTIFTCGNGGSACDAMHFAEELVARYRKDRPGIKAQHFCDAATITCWANDYNFESVFERQVQTFATNKDCLVVFSTSGNSPNILRAVEAAKKVGAKSIALLGKDGGNAKSIADLSLVVDSNYTPHIQQAHIAIVHLICEQLESTLFP